LKNTVLSIKLELKLLPLIVIVLPMLPNAGSIESMTGWEKINDIKNNIDDIYLNTLKSTKNNTRMCLSLFLSTYPYLTGPPYPSFLVEN
jgi:hypothetical protein